MIVIDEVVDVVDQGVIVVIVASTDAEIKERKMVVMDLHSEADTVVDAAAHLLLRKKIRHGRQIRIFTPAKAKMMIQEVFRLFSIMLRAVQVNRSEKGCHFDY